MNELLSGAAETMAEDEQAITRGYKRQAGVIPFIIFAAGASYYLELKHVVAEGFLILLWAVSLCEARLYDLSIRLKRSNQLLRENVEKLSKLNDAIAQLDTRIFHIVNALDLETKSKGRIDANHRALMDRLQRMSRGADAGSADQP